MKKIILLVICSLLFVSCGLLPSGSPKPGNTGQNAPTETPSGQLEVAPSLVPTEVELPTAIPLPPTATVQPSATPVQGAENGVDKIQNDILEPPKPFPFGVQPGSPRRLINFAHPDQGCHWLGIAGQIFDINDQPLANMVIEAGGTLGDNSVFALAVSGLTSAYGPGGYELVLAEQPLASVDSVWVRIFDLQGNALTDRIYVDTVADCGQNLILLNFAQNASYITYEVFMPLVDK